MGAPEIFRAPGRVNLIGEHTDYNLGLVLPMAIDLYCYVTAAPSNDGVLRVRSAQVPGDAEWRIEEIPSAKPSGQWTDRVLGIAWELVRRGHPLHGRNLWIDSEVPTGGGLSSSAALGVATALALGAPADPMTLAEIAHCAETDFAGIPCGIMDQFISAFGQAGSAILLDCRTLEGKAARLPDGIAIVVANSMVKHDLASSAYRIRVEECAVASRRLGIASLRDAAVSDLARLDGTLLRRARHVVTENARVTCFAEALDRNQPENLGRILMESHASLRDDYEVSCTELDFLVETAFRMPGILGARMTGGGFGGSTVNLVEENAAERFMETLADEYRQRMGIVPEIRRCLSSEGASKVVTRHAPNPNAGKER